MGDDNLICIQYAAYLKFPFQDSGAYLTRVRNRPQAGTEVPALLRFLLSMISRKASGSISHLPTIINVPTIARTMLRKKRSADIKYHAVPINRPFSVFYFTDI